MEIIVAQKAGFCFGVKRAIQTAYDTAYETEGEVATLGPLIHNPQVVSRLKEMKVRPVEGLDELRGDTLIIRSHGVPKEVIDDAEGRGLRVINATCPFVKKAQNYASLLQEEGYRVVIVGDKRHPEVRGILAYAVGSALVAEDAEDLDVLGKVARIGVVSQTTTTLERFQRVVGRCLELAGEVKVFNTICDATSIRQREAQEIARKVDVMLVLGGKNSGNTTRLSELCRETGTPTYHTETAAEIDPIWVRAAGKVGITAGASTPQWIIADVVAFLRRLGGEGP
jgi:4-hydroxy-3-methylbut-2-enyl diphosphate reductase